MAFNVLLFQRRSGVMDQVQGHALLRVVENLTSRADNAAFRLTCQSWRAAFDGTTRAVRSGSDPSLNSSSLSTTLRGRIVRGRSLMPITEAG